MGSRPAIGASDEAHDAAIIGAGPTGLAAALALDHIGADVVVIGAAPGPNQSSRLETRTAALLSSSIDFLNALGIWESISAHAAPLKAIRIVDVSRSLFRAPEMLFEAREIGLDAFGYNIANTKLTEALFARAMERLPVIAPATVGRVEIGGKEARAVCDGGQTIIAKLIVGADGRHSVCRKASGIDAREWRYDQAAIATSFSHAMPHQGISTEIHREGGSLTTVPLPDPLASSLIWVGATSEIAAAMQSSEDAFRRLLDERLGGVLGAVGETGKRASFPVVALSAKSLAGNRTALIGEAAHILPPIGAQGLNLGLRDAAALADCVAAALARSEDPGSARALSDYARSRMLDITTRTFGVDLLNRSLLTGFLPLQAARGIALHGLNALPPLRRAIMRAGLLPPTELPRLMRPAPSQSEASRA